MKRTPWSSLMPWLLFAGAVACIGLLQAQTAQAPVPGGKGGPPPIPKKHILVIGATSGFHHGSTSDGMAAFWKMGKDTHVWDTELKTDLAWITNKNPGSEAHSLPFFDAIVFVNTTGNMKLEDEQKQALLAFVHDGKASCSPTRRSIPITTGLSGPR